MKLILTLIAACLLAGCYGVNVKSEPVTTTITDVFQEPSKWNCIGTDWNTVVRTEDNRVASLCGKWGKVGEKVAGCWETGNDPALNGFKLVCRK